MDYDESKREKEKRKQQRDLEKYLDAADKEILTPRGPNGSLRGIDKKRKKIIVLMQFFKKM